jgi:hypothetical protein
VQAELNPFELGEHVAVDVERAVPSNVALDTPQDAERCELVVHRRDLLALAPKLLAPEPGNHTHVRSVVADRKVRVAPVPRGRGHLADGCPSVGPGRMAVEVPAEVGELDQILGRPCAWQLPQLGRAVRQSECREDARLVRLGGQQAQCLHVLG